MDDNSKHIKFFTGSLIQIQRLQLDLDDQQIPSLVKNNFESGLRSGFYGGSPSQVQLFIYQEDLEKAKPILENFKTDLGL
ncbi:putative signal transducing protein [Aureibaculum conchae]|uniref:putative signal transducing protein n=1 Tax=Aureibaculum sp. 2308TA14-22 TaxID=3108392 RepID=UPI003390B028